MKKQFAMLEKTDWKEALTPESNGAFFYHLQRALLLALWEREMLGVAEYRHAEESLRRQRIHQAKKAPEKGGDL